MPDACVCARCLVINIQGLMWSVYVLFALKVQAGAFNLSNIRASIVHAVDEAYQCDEEERRKRLKQLQLRWHPGKGHYTEVPRSVIRCIIEAPQMAFCQLLSQLSLCQPAALFLCVCVCVCVRVCVRAHSCTACVLALCARRQEPRSYRGGNRSNKNNQRRDQQERVTHLQPCAAAMYSTLH